MLHLSWSQIPLSTPTHQTMLAICRQWKVYRWHVNSYGGSFGSYLVIKQIKTRFPFSHNVYSKRRKDPCVRHHCNTWLMGHRRCKPDLNPLAIINTRCHHLSWRNHPLLNCFLLWMRVHDFIAWSYTLVDYFTLHFNFIIHAFALCSILYSWLSRCY